MIYLHIGVHKTATTALQRFFLMNRTALLENNILFPVFKKRFTRVNDRTGYSGLTPAGRNAAALDVLTTGLNSYVSSISSKDNGSDSQPENDLIAMHHYNVIRKLSAEHDIILTDETISTNIMTSELYINRLLQLTECLSGKTKLVVYIREQADFFDSMWKQIVKHLWDDPEEDILRFAAHSLAAKSVDYNRVLSIAEQAFGKENIILRIYDNKSFAGGDIFHDFISSIGFEWNESFVIPTERFNTSLNYDMAYLMRKLRKSEITYMEENCTWRLLKRFLLRTRILQACLSFQIMNARLSVLAMPTVIV